MKNIPVIFLAMASPASAALRDVQRERSVLRKALEKAQVSGQCILLEAEVTSVEDIFQVFRNYPQKISMFHYAGHGNEDALLLYLEKETAKGLSTSALTTLLSDSSIKLAFLNCCSSQSHVEALLGAGAPVVIATSSAVHDDIACDFAQKFYEGLANGHTVKRAFDLSKSELLTRVEASIAPMRGPVMGPRNLGDHAEFWNLYSNDTVQNAETWRLGSDKDEPLPSRQRTLFSSWLNIRKRGRLALFIATLLCLGTLIVVRQPWIGKLGLINAGQVSETEKEPVNTQVSSELGLQSSDYVVCYGPGLVPKTCFGVQKGDGYSRGRSDNDTDYKNELHWVKELQGLLNQKGIKDNSGHSLIEDGVFGTKTLEAVIVFQKQYEIPPTGLVGTCTWTSLYIGSKYPADCMSEVQQPDQKLSTQHPFCENSSKAVDIPDFNLETVLRETLVISDRPLTCVDLLALTELGAEAKKIQSLEGLQYAVNLQSLNLGGNQISDASPLANLTKLEGLSLWGNSLTSLAPLGRLEKLQWLYVGRMPLSDVSPLFNLSNLKLLHMNRSGVSDLSFLSASRYPNLKDLELDGNTISDITPLRALGTLENLSLDNNKIADLTPLVENEGLAEGDVISLEQNPLDVSQDSEDQQNISRLTSRGVDVRY